MIKLKKMVIKEEVDKKELKKQVKIASDALNEFSKAINEFVNIFVRHHKDAGKAIKDPVFVMINRIINVRGKVNKLVAWKKHLAHLDKKL
jgi:ABC-type phosphate transport system ATPase subunit